VQSFNGIPVIVTEDATAEIPRERWDWSRYRSPSRAKRRRDFSRIVMREPAIFKMGDRLIMHPKMWDAIKAQNISPGPAQFSTPFSFARPPMRVGGFLNFDATS
jgi:hypothetical protein